MWDIISTSDKNAVGCLAVADSGCMSGEKTKRAPHVRGCGGGGEGPPVTPLNDVRVKVIDNIW